MNSKVAFLSIFIVFIFFIFVIHLEALACIPSSNKCVDLSCDEFELGTTTIDFDKKNIIACLKNESGGKTWKSTSASSPQKGGHYGLCIENGPGSKYGTNGTCLSPPKDIRSGGGINAFMFTYTGPVSPAYCGGNRCQCQNGYTKVVTGEYHGYEGSTVWLYYYSCVKL